jgi:hypothetical protein
MSHWSVLSKPLRRESAPVGISDWNLGLNLGLVLDTRTASVVRFAQLIDIQ